LRFQIGQYDIDGFLLVWPEFHDSLPHFTQGADGLGAAGCVGGAASGGCIAAFGGIIGGREGAGGTEGNEAAGCGICGTAAGAVPADGGAGIFLNDLIWFWGA